MRRNVELKARLREVAEPRAVVERLAGPGRTLRQADTFFRVSRGRLKLRRCPDGRGELIFYERPDAAGPKLSCFTTTLTDDPDGLETFVALVSPPNCLFLVGNSSLGAQAVLAQVLGVLGVVKKERLLFLVGQTRVHLDNVEGLGDFLELEVVLTGEQSVEDGERVARQLMKELGIEEQDLISGAYLDLLLAKGEGAS